MPGFFVLAGPRDGIAYPAPHLALLGRTIVCIAHRPAESADPLLHDLWSPLHAVESRAMAEHRSDVCRVVLLVADELERDAPEHRHAHELQSWGVVYRVQRDVVRLLGVVVDGVIRVTAGTGKDDEGLGEDEDEDEEEYALSSKGEGDVGIRVHPI